MADGASGASDSYAAIQAWASVVAIVAGFAYVGVQRWIDRRDAAVAAARLARHSVESATERLDALTDPANPIEFALRGARASEMIEVFRELDISKLPSSMVESIAIIRSAVHAVNSRIDEVLNDDANRRHERRSRLFSAGRTLKAARSEYEALQFKFACWNRRSINPLSPKKTLFCRKQRKPRRAPKRPNVGRSTAEILIPKAVVPSI